MRYIYMKMEDPHFAMVSAKSRALLSLQGSILFLMN